NSSDLYVSDMNVGSATVMLLAVFMGGKFGFLEKVGFKVAAALGLGAAAWQLLETCCHVQLLECSPPDLPEANSEFNPHPALSNEPLPEAEPNFSEFKGCLTASCIFAGIQPRIQTRAQGGDLTADGLNWKRDDFGLGFSTPHAGLSNEPSSEAELSD